VTRLGLVLVATAVLLGLAPAAAAPRLDYAGTALNVLPPGQSGSLAFPPNSTDQLALYDGLTPLRGRVTNADLRRFYKSARFGTDGRAVRTVRPRAGVTIVRDRWGVPHVTGRTRPDVAFGAGWATAEDRGLLLALLRGPGRIAALDAPGLDAFALATSAQQFVPSAATERVLAAQLDLLRRQGADGRAVLRDIDAYVAGINAYNRNAGIDVTPWTANDVVAVATLIGAVFGSGGGDEVRASQFYAALEARLGSERARGVWSDLRALDDPDARTAVPGRFPYGIAWTSERGNAVVDDGSFQPWRGNAAPAARRSMSNALLVARTRSATGHPLFVAGPQTGHLYPQILMELDLHGGGVDARGAAFPGISFAVLIGRGKDYAWSATSANSDIVDQVVEVLCGDDLHYRYKGECRAMETFDAGELKGANGRPDEPVVFRTTVHGPVDGYATVDGERVAIARERSTRGREVLSALFFADLNLNRVTSAQTFQRAANRMEMTFNWLYADDRDIAQFTSGRLPLRALDANPSLPRLGTGEFEWRGFAPFSAHARAINPAGGLITNWNNKPAAGFAASDDDWSAGIVQRVDLLAENLATRRKHTLATVVSAMNLAATTDVRGALVWPTIARVLAGGPAPSPRAALAADLVSRWRAAGSSRLDANLDGTIDDPGAAIMDEAWPRLADAVLAPVLGPLVDRLARIERRSDQPGNGNAFGSGWYSYVQKDLATLLGATVRRPYATRYCGGGDLAGCRASLWAALDAAAGALAAEQGPDPAAWRSDAAAERITYGFLPRSMRFANRPTFQQVMTFTGHRPHR
jgi:acyl-homoserine lactone acylase PvdQ